jgi:3-hydroxyacyl-CoA dehydrogenase
MNAMDATQAVNEVVALERREDVALIWIDNPPVNALGRRVSEGLELAVQRVLTDPSLRAIVLACRGRTFIAGADIREFGTARVGNPANPMGAIASSVKPVVAAIHGTAFGGGLEVALCCHARVGLRSAQLGLPEVKLGILPGAGGTQRLPRLVGAEKALDMMTTGDPISAEEALAIGLLDEVASEGAEHAELVLRAAALAQRLANDSSGLRRLHEFDGKLAAVRSDPEFFTRYREKIAQRTRGLEAPEAIVRCVEAAVSKSFDEASAIERASFASLVRSEQSKAQRYYFFAERTAQKIPDVPKQTKQREIKTVGVIGAGTMGGGIAMSFANAGFPVAIVERDQKQLQRGLDVVKRNYESSVRRGRLKPADVERRLALIHGSVALESLAGCDLVVEAVFENMAIKQELFGQLDALCKPGAILASNTSALDLNQIASATRRPADVIGLHFFSPANVMKLIEIVRGKATALDVIATSMAIAKQIGKIGVLVGVCRGFVGNRMLFGRTAQAQKLILQGALPWDVDRVLYDFGFPMGPFAMSDLAGLDIGWSAERSRGETIRDRLCELGRRGQKTGSGYYNYDPETRARTPEPKVAALIEQYAREKGFSPRAIGDAEILERSLYPMINEGAKILQEGIAIRASDIDVIWVNGYGWPVYRGGPMYYADQIGLPNVVAALQRFRTEDHDDFWEPAQLLTKLAAEGKGFGSIADQEPSA